MPLPQPLFNCPVDANYVFLTTLKLDGIEYREGDVLPADSSLRTMHNAERRIRLLVEQRRLGMTMTPALAVAVQEKEMEPPEATKAAAQSSDLEEMDLSQLRAKCKELGLNSIGNQNQLRNRLRSKLG